MKTNMMTLMMNHLLKLRMPALPLRRVRYIPGMRPEPVAGRWQDSVC